MLYALVHEGGRLGNLSPLERSEEVFLHRQGLLPNEPLYKGRLGVGIVAKRWQITFTFQDNRDEKSSTQANCMGHKDEDEEHPQCRAHVQK